MDELDNASDRIQSLMIDMVKVMEKYKNDNEKIVSNIQRELDKSLSQQRKMMVDMVREDLLEKASVQVQEYTEDMNEARR